MDWGIMMKDMFEFFADDFYHIFYFDYDNEKQVVDNLISESRKSFEKFFRLKFPGAIKIDLNSFYGKAEQVLLRDDILSKVHSRDSKS